MKTLIWFVYKSSRWSSAQNSKNYPHQYNASSKINGQNGLCILSKYPLVNRGQLDFSDSNNSGLFADFFIKDSIRIYNIHLESLSINLKDTLYSGTFPKIYTTN